MMIRTTLAATAVAVLSTAAPAAAAATGPGAAPRPATARTDLVVSYMADAGYAAAVTLSCNPPGGAHPHAAEACATLAEVSGKPGRIKPAATMCTMEYAPVTARITGVWQGRRMKWSRTYPNHCEMTRSTGMLLAF
jgi:hypothetical protein